MRSICDQLATKIIRLAVRNECHSSLRAVVAQHL
jgi:hypothetical protein